jgi:hypothetical protein
LTWEEFKVGREEEEFEEVGDEGRQRKEVGRG